MSKQIKTSHFNMRMNEETKEKLISLSSNAMFKYNNSAVIQHLIETAYCLTLNQNERK